jgi:hypothetical protein
MADLRLPAGKREQHRHAVVALGICTEKSNFDIHFCQMPSGILNFGKLDEVYRPKGVQMDIIVDESFH